MFNKAVFLLALLVTGFGRSEAVGYCTEYGGTPYDYRELLCHALVFYEANRSGYLPADQRVEWRYASALNDGADNGVDLVGSYYDAGDLVKFGFPLAFTVTFLSWGYIAYQEGYVQADQVEYFEKTVRWATDFIEKKAHTAPNTIWAQVGDGDIDHALWDRPENMTMPRPSQKLDENSPGTEVAAETAAGLAAVAIIYQNSDPAYAATLLQHAMELFNFANEYRAIYTDSLASPDYYTSYDYGDELTWGAIWLYRATGDNVYLTLAEELFVEFDVAYGSNFSWENKKAGCIALLAELVGGSYIDILQQSMENLRNMQTTPGGMHYFQHWGSLRYALNHAFIAFRAADLGVDVDANIEFGERQINYALGTNPISSSYVVGVGNNPPTHCHHRAASCPDIDIPCGWEYGNSLEPNPHILYGALVGGPDENDDYIDERQNWEQNEVGCDYNAALAGCLARMIVNQPL